MVKTNYIPPYHFIICMESNLTRSQNILCIYSFSLETKSEIEITIFAHVHNAHTYTNNFTDIISRGLWWSLLDDEVMKVYVLKLSSCIVLKNTKRLINQLNILRVTQRHSTKSQKVSLSLHVSEVSVRCVNYR